MSNQICWVHGSCTAHCKIVNTIVRGSPSIEVACLKKEEGIKIILGFSGLVIS